MRAWEAGAFDRPVEMVDGEVIPVVIGDWHGHTTARIVRALPGEGVEITTQTLPAGDSLPDPDCWVRRADARPVGALNERLSRWDPEDVVLVVEVADQTETFDLTAKARLYAAAGFPAYWVVTRDVVVEHLDPGPTGYRRRREHRIDDTVAVPARRASWPSLTSSPPPRNRRRRYLSALLGGLAARNGCRRFLAPPLAGSGSVSGSSVSGAGGQGAGEAPSSPAGGIHAPPSSAGSSPYGAVRDPDGGAGVVMVVVLGAVGVGMAVGGTGVTGLVVAVGMLVIVGVHDVAAVVVDVGVAVLVIGPAPGIRGRLVVVTGPDVVAVGRRRAALDGRRRRHHRRLRHRTAEERLEALEDLDRAVRLCLLLVEEPGQRELEQAGHRGAHEETGAGHHQAETQDAAGDEVGDVLGEVEGPRRPHQPSTTSTMPAAIAAMPALSSWLSRSPAAPGTLSVPTPSFSLWMRSESVIRRPPGRRRTVLVPSRTAGRRR